VWDDAVKKVKSLVDEAALQAASRLTDPDARASEMARLATQQKQRELDAAKTALETKINVSVDPVTARRATETLQQLAEEGARAIAEAQRRARFESLRAQFDEQTESLRLQEQEIQQLVERGALTTEEAERRKIAARDASVPVLRRIVELLREAAEVANVNEQNQVKAAEASTQAWAELRSELARTAEQEATQQLATAMTDIVTGAKSAKEALLDMVRSFARAMINLINQRLAAQLVGQLGQAIGTVGGGGYSGDFTAGGYDPGFTGTATGAGAGSGSKGVAGGAQGVTINVPVTINAGGGASQKQLEGAALDLQAQINATVEAYVVRESRAGGKFARS
jgi:hypothetical protein